MSHRATSSTRGFSRYALACGRPNSPNPITQARTGRGPTRLPAFCLPERMVVGPRGWEPRPFEVLNGGVEVGLPVPQCPHEVPGEELLNEEVLQSPDVVAVVVQVAAGPVAKPDVAVYEHDIGREERPRFTLDEETRNSVTVAWDLNRPEEVT